MRILSGDTVCAEFWMITKRSGYTYKKVPVLRTYGRTGTRFWRTTGWMRLRITLALREYYKLKRIVAICEKSGVHTKFVPDYNDIIPTRPYTEDLLGLPVVNIRHVPLTNTFNMVCKRTVDIVGAQLLPSSFFHQ